MTRTGGRPARRAIARWSVRLLRREWRQQALVVALLTLVVATSIVFTAGTYNAASVSDTATRSLRFGTDAPKGPSATKRWPGRSSASAVEEMSDRAVVL